MNFAQFGYVRGSNVKYNGIDETIERLKDVVIVKNIDGITGFSQHACIGSNLSNQAPLKFFVSVCGQLWNAMFGGKI